MYLDLSALDISKIATYEYWDDYAKQKYAGEAKLCCAGIKRFVVHVKFKYVYADLAGGV